MWAGVKGHRCRTRIRPDLAVGTLCLHPAGLGRSSGDSSDHSRSWSLLCCIAHATTRKQLLWYAQVCAAGTGLIQKLGRVLKEKAQGDLDRVFKGTSKTRQKLGVSRSHCMGLLLCSQGCRTVTHCEPPLLL